MPSATRLPSMLYGLCWAILVLLPAALVFAAVSGAFGAPALVEAFPGVVLSDGLLPWQVAGAGILGLLPWLVVMSLLWRIRGLFDRYRRGQGLTLAAAGDIRAIGFGLIVLGFVKIAAHTGQVLVLSALNPAGERMLALQLGTGEIGFLFAGGLMLAIGQSMRDAVAAAEELRGFV
jgi:hypothetical protein